MPGFFVLINHQIKNQVKKLQHQLLMQFGKGFGGIGA